MMSLPRAWSLAILAVAVFVSGGCSASTNYPGSPPPATSVAPVLPPGGVFLTDLGFTEAPPEFSVPASVKMQSGYNIPELINVLFAGADGPVVYAYLVANLPGMGYTITGQSADSIVWHNDDWDGAFTMTPAQAGLTLRRTQ